MRAECLEVFSGGRNTRIAGLSFKPHVIHVDSRRREYAAVYVCVYVCQYSKTKQKTLDITKLGRWIVYITSNGHQFYLR